jgi:hypothetical protein
MKHLRAVMKRKMPRTERFLVQAYIRAQVCRSSFVNRKKTEIIDITSPLILISQVQRSGGTLMSQLFNDHSEIYAYPYDIYWGKPGKWNWPDLDLSDMSISRMYKKLNEPYIDRFIAFGYSKQIDGAVEREVFPFHFNRRLQKRIFFQHLKKNPPKRQRDILNCYMTSFFNAWIDFQNLNGENKKYITGFIPRVNMYPDSSCRFFRDYPDGYLISIVRHPASWFTSARRHDPSLYGDLNNALCSWSASVKSSLELKRCNKQKVILVLFENLILDTKGTMEKICDEVGLSWNDTLITPTFNSMSIRANSSFNVKKHGIIRETVNRFTNILTTAEIRSIEDKAIPLYEESKLACVNKLCRS